MNTVRFSHINIVSKDWRRLAKFYVDVFCCVPVYPERDLSGGWIEKLTRIDDVKIEGIHLKLPGDPNGATLEIFEYNKTIQTQSNSINEIGFRHIAFHVDDVEQIMQRLIEAGGEMYGQMTEKYFKGIGHLKVVYARDIDGNIIEIQNWAEKTSQ